MSFFFLCPLIHLRRVCPNMFSAYYWLTVQSTFQPIFQSSSFSESVLTRRLLEALRPALDGSCMLETGCLLAIGPILARTMDLFRTVEVSVVFGGSFRFTIVRFDFASSILTRAQSWSSYFEKSC